MGGIPDFSVEPETQKFLIHENRIGTLEGQFKVVEVKLEAYGDRMVLMTKSFDDLRASVVDGNKETMAFLQSVVKHDQGIEKTKIEFEQKLQQIKIDNDKKAAEMETERARKELEVKKAQEDFEREQKAQSREDARKALKQFAVWFAPVMVVASTLISEWLPKIFT